MDLNEYQEKARATAFYPDRENNLVYPVLGLCGESGELAEKLKKMIRDDGGILTPERKKLMIKELGDVMWYVADIASVLKISLNEVALKNIEKLQSRKDRNVLQGDGDER